MRKSLKAIFLDRDGVLNWEPPEGPPNYTSVNKLSLLRIYKDIKFLRKLNQFNYQFFIVTNQEGIARKLLTIKEYYKIQKRVIKALSRVGVRVKETVFCPHWDPDYCNCRKPKTGMIDRLERKYNIDFKNSWFIGDNPNTDILLAEKIGCHSILVDRTGKYQRKKLKVKPEIKVRTLSRAVNYIITN